VRIALYILVTFVTGCIFACIPVGAFCSLPGVRFSNACGHNAVYWFILTLPLGFILAALLAARLCEASLKWSFLRFTITRNQHLERPVMA
jgi:hypothetical protein